MWLELTSSQRDASVSVEENKKRSSMRVGKTVVQLRDFCAVLAGCLLLGCVDSNIAIPVQREKSEMIYVIIGFGVVRVGTDTNTAGVRAAAFEAAGAMFSADPAARITLGYTTGYSVAVPSDATGVIVEQHVSGSGRAQVRVDTAPAAPRPPRPSRKE